MEIKSDSHLSYCTNIHPGETWDEVFTQLQAYVPGLKNNLSPDQHFGIGLRLSNQASCQILQADHLAVFKKWLQTENVYVFTMNGFPYGGFHRQKVKDLVHQPDWTTADRANYTNRLFNILAQLLPEDTEGGVSTSPLSYKYWHNTPDQMDQVYKQSTKHLAEVVAELIKIKKATGRSMHLDIEPEPDGVLENSSEVLDYFTSWLLPKGSKHLQERLGITSGQAEASIREHIQVCYDVCHFAVAFEDHHEAIDRFADAGWQIGKIQISAALKADIPQDRKASQLVRKAFEQFNESTYLHQVVAKNDKGVLLQYPDLGEALADFYQGGASEWRAHFHVPIFLKDYQELQSTQDDIIEVLNIWQNKPFTQHLEVETYTWEVLPPAMQTHLASSIERELKWVIDQLN